MKIDESSILLAKVVDNGKIEMERFDINIMEYKLKFLEGEKEFFVQITDSFLDTPYMELIPSLSTNLIAMDVDDYGIKTYYDLLEYCILASDGESQQTIREYVEGMNIDALKLPFKLELDYHPVQKDSFFLSDELPTEYLIKKNDLFFCGWLEYPESPIFSSTEEPQSFIILEVASFFAAKFGGEIIVEKN
ncbi:hypothetical protein HCI99_04835 [Listeria booriae]|uniref:Uncharacterized protein n=1 Tax=Listeria booriae TaxID=1552123 RepID=A0A7X0XBL9_9LIST|nr:hypothetical protein [Listeria booriae]MBC1490941.1 hypothetical protein [Listeria booriae]MBC1491144.1 hypothetical protein [Listeria booriae]MBC6151024.1 hypothetical protein [Listeria booriae]MBC6151227.1 hypothetical protein [Listeria booriae]